MAERQDPVGQDRGSVVINDRIILYSDDHAPYVARDLKGVACSTHNPEEAWRFLRNYLRRRPRVRAIGSWDIPEHVKLWTKVSDLFSLIRF